MKAQLEQLIQDLRKQAAMDKQDYKTEDLGRT
jgi:hypothetical protein